MALVIPPRLRPGDTVGLVSPSAGVAGLVPHRIDRAAAFLASLGYKIKIAPQAIQTAGYLSGTVEERVADLRAMFADPEVRMILCTIGGNHSNQLLRHLDYDLVRRDPKIFMGYSDITVLHYAFQSQANLATYYGPCAMTQFAEFPTMQEYTLSSFVREVTAAGDDDPYNVPASSSWTNELLDWFTKADLTRPRAFEENEGYEWLVSGRASGPALGGAILSLNHLAGTRYWVDPAGTIFFLDILKTKELDLSAVDALLADLDNLWVFDGIRGLVVGRPADYGPKEIVRLKELLLRYAGKKKYPILFNANLGHTDPILTIRYGRTIQLDAGRNLLRFG
ncbi:MAG: LD-carboxypeptidase [Candidatus Woesebacteria bacterium]|nr:LD-carboxypeptidase [Candidatus Woesebacteria bacterium]